MTMKQFRWYLSELWYTAAHTKRLENTLVTILLRTLSNSVEQAIVRIDFMAAKKVKQLK